MAAGGLNNIQLRIETRAYKMASVELDPQRTFRDESEDGTEIEGLLIDPAERRGRFRRRREQEGAPLITVVHRGPESHHPDG